MARFNAAIEFVRKKKLSVPVVQVPDNVKDFLGIDKVHPNGIFKIEPGNGLCLYDRCYIFEDINYVNKDDNVKTSTLSELVSLFKRVDNQLKITLASEQTNMDKFMEQVFRPIHGEEYPDLNEGIGVWINQKINEGTRDIECIRYLTVTCYTYSFEDAEAFFATLEDVLNQIFMALGSRLYRMNGEERLAVLQRILRLNQGGIAPKNIRTDSDGWKNQILPAYIHAEEDGILINNKYACVLFAQDYDSQVNEENLLYSLTKAPFPVYTTVDIERVKRRMVKDKLLNAHANNERAIGFEQEAAKSNRQIYAGPSYQKSENKKELEDMLKQVERNDEDGAFVGLLVMVYADSVDELTHRVNAISKIAESSFTLVPYYHQQLRALTTLLPMGGRQVDNMRFLFTSSVVAFQPFHAKDLRDPEGYVLGRNGTTNRLLIGNPKTLPAPHSIVISHTGGGKSYFVNSQISQELLFSDDKLICIDPNNERKIFITEHGGQYFEFTPRCGIHLNAFEVPRWIWEGDAIDKDQFIAKKCEYASRFTTSCMKNIVVTQVYLNYVEDAVRLMYDTYFSGKKYESQPTWQMAWDNLKVRREASTDDIEKRHLFDIIKCLESFVIGVYDTFAHPSNLDINNRLVGFGLLNIPQEAREPYLLTMMHFVAMRIENNQGDMIAEHLIVEEAQSLCKNDFIAAEFMYAIETYRKLGAMVTMIVQNLTYVLRNPQLCDMFSNCPYKVFFDLGGVDAEKLTEIVDLSLNEFKILNKPKKGCGLLMWNGEVYHLDNFMDKSNVLYEQFNTDFHEKAKLLKGESS